MTKETAMKALRNLKGPLNIGITGATLVHETTETGQSAPRLVLATRDDTSLARKPGVTDWMEALLSGSTTTPTVVHTFVTGGTAFHNLFDALDPELRMMLDEARKSRRFGFGVSLPEGTAFISGDDQNMSDWQSLAGKAHAGRERWTHQVAGLVPALPTCLSAAMPGLRGVRDHRVRLVLTLDELMAARRG
ncbi:MAG: hypothetical protein ACJ79X_11225 [Gemmatimonadaceae bacterium]